MIKYFGWGCSMRYLKLERSLLLNKSENEKYKEGIEINQKKKSIENKENDVCERFSFMKIEHDVKRYCSIN